MRGYPGVFTIAHFATYPALLVQLDVVGKSAMTDLVLDAWLAAAPEPLDSARLADHDTRPAR